MRFEQVTYENLGHLAMPDQEQQPDGYWMDWDAKMPLKPESMIKELVRDHAFDRPTLCVLAEDLKSIPTESVLNNPEFAGVLFVEKSQVPRVNGSYDVDRLFANIPEDQPPVSTDPGPVEQWEEDSQGYLVIKTPAGDGPEAPQEADNRAEELDPYAAAVRFLLRN